MGTMMEESAVRWMLQAIQDEPGDYIDGCGDIDMTELAEEYVRHCGLDEEGGLLDDSDHEVWGWALQAREQWEARRHDALQLDGATVTKAELEEAVSTVLGSLAMSVGAWNGNPQGPYRLGVTVRVASGEAGEIAQEKLQDVLPFLEDFIHTWEPDNYAFSEESDRWLLRAHVMRERS